MPEVVALYAPSSPSAPLASAHFATGRIPENFPTSGCCGFASLGLRSMAISLNYHAMWVCHRQRAFCKWDCEDRHVDRRSQACRYWQVGHPAWPKPKPGWLAPNGAMKLIWSPSTRKLFGEMEVRNSRLNGGDRHVIAQIRLQKMFNLLDLKWMSGLLRESMELI